MPRPSPTRRGIPALLSLLVTAAALALGPSAASGAEAPPGWWEPVARSVPDSQINVTGEPFRGTDPQGTVRGFVDAHNHIMSNEAFGGRLIRGKAFSEHGVADALKDCPEHHPDGSLALFDFITEGGDGKHDPNGWPAFADWPAHDSLTHQQNYYAWIERAWRGGQRVLVNHLVTNGVICSLYFFEDRGCDEMTSLRLQARKTYEMQAYVDRMYGGPGKGRFRIVTDSARAREVVRQGRLAVVLGVETSEPFGCKHVGDAARCDREDIDRGLDDLYGLGVRSMFLCHKFDNALCGVRFDSGALGTAVNVGQFLSTGTFWKTERCTGPQHDSPVGGAPAPGAGAKLPPGADVPDPVRYPFRTADGGSVVDRQTTGQRTWDLNEDGAAHYGLVPDWVEDIRGTGGGDVVDDLLPGAEPYLRTWGASERHDLGANLAAGTTATASSTQWWDPLTGHAPGRAVDGDTRTRWASERSDDQWLRIDPGAVRAVGRVTLDWEEAYARAYRVEVSADGSAWRTVWSTTAGDGGLDTARFAPGRARYVRVHGLERGTRWGYSLREVGVHDGS